MSVSPDDGLMIHRDMVPPTHRLRAATSHPSSHSTSRPLHTPYTSATTPRNAYRSDTPRNAAVSRGHRPHVPLPQPTPIHARHGTLSHNYPPLEECYTPQSIAHRSSPSMNASLSGGNKDYPDPADDYFDGNFLPVWHGNEWNANLTDFKGEPSSTGDVPTDNAFEALFEKYW